MSLLVAPFLLLDVVLRRSGTALIAFHTLSELGVRFFEDSAGPMKLLQLFQILGSAWLAPGFCRGNLGVTCVRGLIRSPCEGPTYEYDANLSFGV